MKRPDDWFLTDYVRQHGRSKARKPALLSGNEVMCWQELAGRMENAANWLKSRNLTHGARVAYLISDGVRALEVTLAAWRAHAVAVPISLSLTPDQLRAVVKDADAAILIIDHSSVAAAHSVSDCVAIAHLDSMFSMREALQPGAENALDAPRHFDDIATVIYSSGTTGAPKGIAHSARARLQMALTSAVALRINESSVALLATPLSSNASWLLMLPALLAGATLVWMPSFSTTSWWHALRAGQVTHAFGVPVMWKRILADNPQDQQDTGSSSLQVALSAGSALAIDTKLALRERFGDVIFELYGCTEGVATLLTPEAAEEKRNTVGQASLGTEVAVLVDGNRLAKPGELGEVIGRSSSMMCGYFRRPVETAEALWGDEAGADWIRTGDIGSMDSAGYLSIKDRIKDMLVSGGQNVYPGDIETVILGHPDVLEAAVVGVKHETWDEVPAALVRVRSEGSPDSTQLMTWVNEKVAKHQRLHRLVLADAPLPRNALGKVLKQDIRALLRSMR